MKQWILQYWIEFLFGVLVSSVGVSHRILKKRIRQGKEEQEAIKAGMIAILHDRLFQICSEYLSKGFIPVEDSEQVLDNAKMIYDAYHAIGGNGTGTAIYEKFCALKIRNPKPEELQ